MKPIVLKITPEDLNRLQYLTNASFQQTTADLPLPGETGALLVSTKEQLEKVVERISTDASDNENARNILTSLRESFLQIPAEDLAERLCLVAWDRVTIALEGARSNFSPSTSVELLREYDTLIEMSGRCARATARHVITFELSGDDACLSELQQTLVAELTEVLEDAQANLAERYGWKRGRTAHGKPGYNPPDHAQLSAVHDPDSEEPNGLSRFLLERIRQQLGQQ